jgi:hypothetical protein
MAKISEMEPAAAGAELYRQYMSAHDAWVADHDVRHPSFDTKAWRQTARDAGTLREAATDEGGLGPVEIQNKAKDDEQPELTAGGNAGNGGPTPAQDGRYVVGLDGQPRFEHANGRVTTGADAIVARAGTSNPTRAANMASRIKNYTRLP